MKPNKIEPNYEAIGRYFHAVDEARSYASERDERLNNVRKLLSPSGSNGAPAQYLGGVAFAFDPAAIHAEIDKAAAVHLQLIAAVGEANAQAKLCGREELKLI